MPIPSRENIHLPVLKVINDAGGSVRPSEAISKVMELYPAMTDVDKASRTPNGQNRINLRIRWARKDLVLDGYVDGSTYGIWKITDKGRKYLEENWSAWVAKYAELPENGQAQMSAPVSATVAITPSWVQSDSDVAARVVSPSEMIQSLQQQISQSTQSELLQRLRNLAPSAFEQLVAEVLEKLGYGSLEDKSIIVTGRSGDGGIDGVCSFDRLGLIKVKFQAKRYAENNHISRDTLSSFIGSLDERGYGVFVTTSDFTRDAVNWLGHRAERIRLINGRELARIMAESGLGVRKRTIEISDDIDEDYFNDLA